jgi:predicted ABC-type transport system involved in lysophospholipase L1 biosynthesis ATPase subunit
MPAVHADALVRSFGTVDALRGVSLTVAEGERVALLGRSGSGKSTLLHLLAGLDRPTAGTLAVLGRELSSLDSGGLAAYRLRTVGVIFQAFHLIPARTALENVALPLLLAGVGRAEREGRAADALREVGLESRLNAFPPTLSGGEAQRVAIARALVHHPPLVLADEPTGNLDTANAEAVMALLLEETRKRGVTLVLVTHDEALAGRVADRVLRMADGRLEGG